MILIALGKMTKDDTTCNWTLGHGCWLGKVVTKQELVNTVYDEMLILKCVRVLIKIWHLM